MKLKVDKAKSSETPVNSLRDVSLDSSDSLNFTTYKSVEAENTTGTITYTFFFSELSANVKANDRDDLPSTKL